MGIFNIEAIDLIQNELIENWRRLQTGRLPYRIASLR
jgi:hypothetical protein